MGRQLEALCVRLQTGFHEAVPERQIFFRSRGDVHFVRLSSGIQVVIALITVAATAWIGVASTNFLFKDQIIAAQMRRVDQISHAYTQLKTELVELQQGLAIKATDLEAQQRYLNTRMDREAENTSQIPSASPAAGKIIPAAQQTEQPVRATGQQSSKNPFERIYAQSSALFEVKDTADSTAGLSDFASLAERLEIIAGSQNHMVAALLGKSQTQLTELETIIATMGLTADDLLSSADAVQNNSLGGPFIPVEPDDHIAHQAQPPTAGRIRAYDTGTGFMKLVLQEERIADLKALLAAAPVLKPVGHYYVSGSFGRRRDPFRKTIAFHGGLDMAGNWKTPIVAPAPGTVRFAGRNGPYGKMIEIDHGNGFKTRYGHLQTIFLKNGEQVAAGQKIGLMGNTGRSTGTHLHYEIWFDGKPRNPLNFFKAAQYVSKIKDNRT